MVTVKMIFHNDSGEKVIRNVPIDLVDDIEELPLYEFKEMNIFTDGEVIYIPQPREVSETIIFN